MKMLYFSTIPPDITKQLDQLIESYVPAEAIETYRDIESICRRLQQPLDNVSLVLLATEHNGLERLQLYVEQLHELRLVVVLPDKARETVALGNRLQPRFLSYTSGNLSVVKAVLKKHFSPNTQTA